MYIQFLTQWCWFYPNWFVNSWDILLKHKKMLVFSPIFYVCAQIAAYFCLKPKKNYSIEKLMKRSVENWYYNLKLNENWRSYATLKLSYLKIMEVAISTRLEPAVMCSVVCYSVWKNEISLSTVCCIGYVIVFSAWGSRCSPCIRWLQCNVHIRWLHSQQEVDVGVAVPALMHNVAAVPAFTEWYGCSAVPI